MARGRGSSNPVQPASTDNGYMEWCRRDFTVPLQPPRAPPPVQPARLEPLSCGTAAGRPSRPQTTQAVERRRIPTDHISEFVPPSGTLPLARDATKFDALTRTTGWAPHSGNVAGARRAVYDPVSHKTTLYTFGSSDSVERLEGRGDGLLKQRREEDMLSGKSWHGRRKGVVEFVDRTHSHAVNLNGEFRRSCAQNMKMYHPKVGEMTNWFDNAFMSNCKVPFYGRTPVEMGRK